MRNGNEEIRNGNEEMRLSMGKTSSLYQFLVTRNYGSTVNLTVRTDSELCDTFETDINSDSEVDQPRQ